MAITNGYATLNELKARVGIPVADTTDDAILEAVVEAASRTIDVVCNRQFFSSAAQTRYFDVHSGVKVFIDDLQSATLVATDRNLDRTFSNTVVSADYELGPLSNAAYGRPYTVIESNHWQVSRLTSDERCSRLQEPGDGLPSRMQ